MVMIRRLAIRGDLNIKGDKVLPGPLSFLCGGWPEPLNKIGAPGNMRGAGQKVQSLKNCLGGDSGRTSGFGSDLGSGS